MIEKVSLRQGRTARLPAALAGALLLLFLTGCTKIATRVVSGTVESLGVSAARDEDPEFVRDALPLALKLVEAGILQRPNDKGLLLQACSGFTQYAQAFVVQPADFLEDSDLTAARLQRRRASRLFLRARSYCLRALEASHKGIGRTLTTSPQTALELVRKEKEVPLLYWTGASWAAAINMSRQDYDLVADLRVAHELLKRALKLDPSWDEGSVHELLISVEAARAPSGGSIEKAREHYARVLALSEGKKLGPMVAVAESIDVKEQNFEEFQQLLNRVLAFDLDSAPKNRLANTLAQRRAQWLLERKEELFIETETSKEENQ